MAEKTPKQPEIERLLVGWVREAGEIALNFFHHSGPLRFKHGREAVTEADREIEKLLSARIRARFPEDGVFGEEFGRVGPGAASPAAADPADSADPGAPDAGPDARDTATPPGRVWHIDPIDGTLNFAVGLPNFCTSVALMDGEKILAAIIHQPLLDETFTATAGEGARLGGQPIHVSDRAALREAIVSAQLQKRGRFISNAALLQAVLMGTMKMRRLGTIALEMAYLADGRFDALVAGKGSPQPLYDVAAGILIIREAGGTVTDHLGEPYRPYATDLIASNGLVHDELIALIRQWDPQAPA